MATHIRAAYWRNGVTYGIAFVLARLFLLSLAIFERQFGSMIFVSSKARDLYGRADLKDILLLSCLECVHDICIFSASTSAESYRGKQGI